MDRINVEYTQGHWENLRKLREQAEDMMRPLAASHIDSFVYGSIARGDVSESSDIDVFIPSQLSPTLIEAALMRHNVNISRREIIQATPGYAAKAYLYIDDRKGYSFPLIELRPSESEFYRYAGSATLRQISEHARVPGVDKRLMLIEPTVKGHYESPIQGREGAVASLLDVSTKIVSERIRTLERRSAVGRTGVYVKRELGRDEDIATVFKELVRARPALRRRIRQKR